MPKEDICGNAWHQGLVSAGDRLVPSLSGLQVGLRNLVRGAF